MKEHRTLDDEPVIVRLGEGPSHVMPFGNTLTWLAAEGYNWLNRTIAIGRGKAIAGGVEYRIWAVSDPA